jgi:D-alanyl-D-alanine dipeptidase
MKKLAAVLLFVACAHSAPTIPLNKYGLAVVATPAVYQETVRADRDKELVDLERAIPNLRLDIRYATEDNFMHERLYPVAKAYARRPTANALLAVQKELAAKGLGLKIFDAYRPYRITEKMWEPYKNPDFVADPAKGSRHNRGCAVDLTIVHLDSGAELEMGTPYDVFTPAAAHAFVDLPAEALANRALLREMMERHGFKPLPSEWWHYDLVGYERFELMDIPLEELPALLTP